MLFRSNSMWPRRTQQLQLCRAEGLPPWAPLRSSTTPKAHSYFLPPRHMGRVNVALREFNVNYNRESGKLYPLHQPGLQGYGPAGSTRTFTNFTPPYVNGEPNGPALPRRQNHSIPASPTDLHPTHTPTRKSHRRASDANGVPRWQRAVPHW